jgi:FHA domain
MFPTWRLKLREARVAWKSGRVDEAGALLAEESLRDFLPAKRLAQDVAGKIVERAGDRFARGDSLAGWQDLAVADRLGGQAEAIGQLRRQYAERSLAEARRYLASGQAAAAAARLDKLQRKGLSSSTSRVLRQIASLLDQADKAAAHGRFAVAEADLAQARRLVADQSATADTMEITAWLDERGRHLAQHETDSLRLSAELHAALGREDWPAVLGASESLLAIAPLHAAARQARNRAWKVVGMNVTSGGDRPPVGRVALELNRGRGGAGRYSTRPGVGSGEVDTVTGNERPQSLLLWVDAVGGFLICLDDQIVLGQPSPGGSIALPFLADLSRRHAVIRRDGGSYVLEPVHETKIDGRVATGPVVLSSGQLIELGDSVRLRFSKPHALSATARIDIESNHKTQPSADAVLLMADSCVMGPNRHCHVQCRDWQHDVILYRQSERPREANRPIELYCRSEAPLAVDGEPSHGATKIAPGARIEGEDFSFTLEEVTT